MRNPKMRSLGLLELYAVFILMGLLRCTPLYFSHYRHGIDCGVYRQHDVTRAGIEAAQLFRIGSSWHQWNGPGHS